jgi:16S rRNA U516 pseudouridylate synthase RsuA-like enzyme
VRIGALRLENLPAGKWKELEQAGREKVFAAK